MYLWVFHTEESGHPTLSVCRRVASVLCVCACACVVCVCVWRCVCVCVCMCVSRYISLTLSSAPTLVFLSFCLLSFSLLLPTVFTLSHALSLSLSLHLSLSLFLSPSLSLFLSLALSLSV